jgi:hypothetical protein
MGVVGPNARLRDFIDRVVNVSPATKITSEQPVIQKDPAYFKPQ